MSSIDPASRAVRVKGALAPIYSLLEFLMSFDFSVTQRRRLLLCWDNASCLIFATITTDRTARVATVTGSPKRRGPALPGLTKRILPCFLMTGLCE
jgi:hypothetical protein